MKINWNLLPLTFLTLPVLSCADYDAESAINESQTETSSFVNSNNNAATPIWEVEGDLALGTTHSPLASFSNINELNWTPSAPGVHTNVSGNLILGIEPSDQTQIHIENTKNISQPGIASSITATALEGSGTLKMVNEGSVSNQALGSFLYCNSLKGTDPKVWNWTLVNNGSVHGPLSVGVISVIEEPFTMDAGEITLSNTGSLSESSKGVLFRCGGYTQTDGTFTLEKTSSSVSSHAVATEVNVNGPMLISGGTYENNGRVLVKDSLILENAGVIKGSGTFAGIDSFGSELKPLNEFINRGTLIPGNSPGICNIVGNYTQESDGTTVIHILNASGPGPNGYSQVNVTGSAHVSGTLEIVLDPGADVGCGDSFTILQASQGITGKFDIVNAPTLDWDLCPDLCYLPNSIILSFCDIFSLCPCPCLSGYLGNFTQTIMTSITDTNNFFIKRELQHLQQRIQSTDTTKYSGNAYIVPIGSIGKSDQNGNQVGFNYWSAGGILGADYVFSKGGAGGLACYENINSYDVRCHWGNFQAQRAHASLYGTYLPTENKKFSIDGMLGGGYDWYEINRNEGHLNKEGNPNGYELDGMISFEYMMTKNDSHLVPMINLQYIHLHVGKYFEEKDCISEFWFKSQNINSLSTILGLWGDKTWKWKHPLTAQANLGWQREYLNHDRTLHYSAQSIELPGAARNNLLAGLNFLVQLKDKWSVEASYDLIWNHQFDRNSFYLGLNGAF